MKRIVALLLVVVSAFMLCSCGQKSNVDIIRDCIKAYKEDSGLGNEGITISAAGIYDDGEVKVAVVEYIKGTKTTTVAIDTETHEYTTEFGYSGLSQYRMLYLLDPETSPNKTVLTREEVNELN